jgi:hypothetical protein
VGLYAPEDVAAAGVGLIQHFNERLRPGPQRHVSARRCGLGILVFAASSFAPTRRFAWMLALLVAAALVGDLVLLPALLTGPLGRFFRPRDRPRQAAAMR